MGKNIIVTSGPTNETLDAVMQITNMSTGSLGTRVVEALLANHGDGIDKIYYVSPKLARKPAPDSKITYVNARTAEKLLRVLTELLSNPDEHIDAVVHSAAVGDYKGRYAVRAEDLADEIFRGSVAQGGMLTYDQILSILKNPACVQDNSTKISSYEPNLMFMLDLTPKVIGSIKATSPSTMLIGFKLLEGVTEEKLLEVASRLRQKNSADYIIANDLSRIGNGKHWAMVVGKDGVEKTCETKDEIARAIAGLVMEQ